MNLLFPQFTIRGAIQAINGRGPGDPAVASQFLQDMTTDPERFTTWPKHRGMEYAERNRVEARQAGRLSMKAKGVLRPGQVSKRTAGLGTRKPI